MKRKTQTFSEEFDFHNLSLGPGTSAEKREKLEQMVFNITNDQKQVKICKETIRKIRQNKSRRNVMKATQSPEKYYHLDESQMSLTQISQQDYIQMNNQLIQNFMQCETDWRSYFK